MVNQVRSHRHSRHAHHTTSQSGFRVLTIDRHFPLGQRRRHQAYRVLVQVLNLADRLRCRVCGRRCNHLPDLQFIQVVLLQIIVMSLQSNLITLRACHRSSCQAPVLRRKLLINLIQVRQFMSNQCNLPSVRRGGPHISRMRVR